MSDKEFKRCVRVENFFRLLSPQMPWFVRWNRTGEIEQKKCERKSTLCCNRSSAFSSIIASLRLTLIPVECACVSLCTMWPHSRKCSVCRSLQSVTTLSPYTLLMTSCTFSLTCCFYTFLLVVVSGPRQFVPDQTKEHRLRTTSETKENHTHTHENLEQHGRSTSHVHSLSEQ